MHNEPNWEVQEGIQRIALSPLPPNQEGAWKMHVPVASFALVLLSSFFLLWHEYQIRQKNTQLVAAINNDETHFEPLPLGKDQMQFSEIYSTNKGIKIFNLDYNGAVNQMSVVGDQYQVSLSNDLKAAVKTIINESLSAQMPYLSIGIKSSPHANQSSNWFLQKNLLLEAFRAQATLLGVHKQKIMLFDLNIAANPAGAIDSKGQNVDDNHSARLQFILSTTPLDGEVLYAAP